jgi:hypothetical protein
VWSFGSNGYMRWWFGSKCRKRQDNSSQYM